MKVIRSLGIVTVLSVIAYLVYLWVRGESPEEVLRKIRENEEF